MDVSIVIPTKNGGALFDEVLTMIDKQETELFHDCRIIIQGLIKYLYTLYKSNEKNSMYNQTI